MKNKSPKPKQALPKLNGRLIIIASEDTYIVEDYFSVLNEFVRVVSRNLTGLNKFSFETLPARDGKSSPEAVRKTMCNHIKDMITQQKRKNDEYWIVLDRDNWPMKELDAIEAFCRELRNIEGSEGETAAVKINFAHSNPCFALWLWWHLEDGDLTQIEVPAVENPEIKKYCSPLEKLLNESKVLIGGKKLSTEAPITLTTVKNAVERARNNARKNGEDTEDIWLRKAGSHVYRILEPLLKDLQA